MNGTHREITRLASNEPSPGSSVEDSYALSPMQQGMLFHALLEQGTGVDIEQMLFELDEAIDASALRWAWNCALSRHPALRTGFVWEGIPEPMQQVVARVDLPWREIDWTHVASADVEKHIETFLIEDRRLGFDLASAPLFRITLLKLADAKYRLIWTVHHVVLDGRSFAEIIREVFGHYDTDRHNREARAATPRPFRDYIGWLDQRDPAGDEAFWRTNLAGFVAPTALAIDHAPVQIPCNVFPKGAVETALSSEATRRLRELAQQHGFSLSTMVHGAWALLLHRYSGERDVVFGAVRANRRATIDGADTMVGMLINTAPVRLAIRGEATVVSWLQHVHGRLHALRGREHAPLADIQSWSEVEAGTPLFHSTVMFDTGDLDSRMRGEGGAWAGRRIRTWSQTNFPLDLAAYDGEQLRLHIDFDRRRIDADAASRMAGHLATLLAGMADGADVALDRLPLLSEPERRQLTIEWNDTAKTYPTGTLLHELFEAQCRRTPQSVEVVYEGQQLTNRELDTRSNRLARFLQRRGVGPDVPVAILMERCPEMVIAILGTLKAGGAYVPIDPGLPADRVAHILHETRAPVVLTLDQFRRQLSANGASALSLDTQWKSIARLSGRRPKSRATADNLAYIIYTSGSTGKPKGVLISHAAICNHMHWMKQEHGLASHDVELQKSPFGFDASVWEFFAPLMSEAQLVMPRPDGHLDTPYLAEMIRSHRVTTLQVVPSQLRMLLEEPAFLDCDGSLRRVYCGGEPLTRDLVDIFHGKFAEARLFNMYGPTEGAIDATCWPCPRDGLPAAIPIGKPIANVRAYIVDADMRLLPIGVPGELLIGGAGLARGYLGDVGLTTARFQPDPFCDQPGARVYRTGDRARYLADGNIEYLGRLDDQVKIRGFRIEPGEIEAVILSHSAVQEAVVMAREFAPQDLRLVAYVTAPAAPADLVEQLQETLRSKLPEHMVPAYFVALDAFPLSISGKVDRKSLPIPHHSALQESSYVAPRTPLEEALAATWRDVFHLEHIGIRDNFFDLGGHSLLLARLVSRINKEQRVSLGVPDIIRNPTIEQVAKEIQRQHPENTPLSSVVPMREGRGGIPIYFIYAGPAEFRIAAAMDGDSPVYGLEARWPMAWRTALAENRVQDYPGMRQLVAPYAAALHAHVGEGRCAIAGLSYAGLIAFEAAHQIEELGGKVDVVFLLDTQARPPSPYRLAWQTWRQNWLQSAGVPVLADMKVLARRLKKLAKSALWVVKKAACRIGALLKRPEPDLETLTGLLDEQGAPLPWGLVDRLYQEIDKTWYPRQLDGRGVLLRTSEIDGQRIIAADEAYGWENAFSDGLEIVPLSGEHYSIFKEHISTIARVMDREVGHDARTLADHSAR